MQPVKTCLSNFYNHGGTRSGHLGKIFLLGDCQLYEISEPVIKEDSVQISDLISVLHGTMMVFRKQYGFGRAIAVLQIGVMKHKLTP